MLTYLVLIVCLAAPAICKLPSTLSFLPSLSILLLDGGSSKLTWLSLSHTHKTTSTPKQEWPPTSRTRPSLARAHARRTASRPGATMASRSTTRSTSGGCRGSRTCTCAGSQRTTRPAMPPRVCSFLSPGPRLLLPLGEKAEEKEEAIRTARR